MSMTPTTITLVVTLTIPTPNRLAIGLDVPGWYKVVLSVQVGGTILRALGCPRASINNPASHETGYYCVYPVRRDIGMSGT